MKKIASVFMLTVLLLTASGCSHWKKWEKQALTDADTLTKEDMQQFMDCYPWPKTHQYRCWSKAIDHAEGSVDKEADSVAYGIILAKRAANNGFSAWLTQQGHTCKEVRDGPIYSRDKQCYQVVCGEWKADQWIENPTYCVEAEKVVKWKIRMEKSERNN